MVAVEVPTKLVPRHYQQIGIDFLKNKKRALLYDDPGLGKTLQAILAAQEPVLVACPTYLVEQWADVIKSQLPGTEVAFSLEKTPLKRIKDLNKPEARWTIVNTEMLRSYQFGVCKTLIIDEAHHVRNRDAKVSKRAAEIASMTEYVYLLTATPIYKETDDLFMLLHILHPKIFSSYHRFVDLYCNTEKGYFSTKILGAKYPSAVKKMLNNYALGRKASDVGLELPPTIEKEVHIKMHPKMMEIYNNMKREYRLLTITFANAGALLQGLRTLTVCPEKLDAAKGIIEDCGELKSTIFCWYIHTAHALGDVLKCPVISGEMPVVERVRIAKSDARVIVTTLASLSEGVDLSDRKNVIFFEEDYTPGMMFQAFSRSVRPTKNNEPVRISYLMMKNTVDEIVHAKRMKRDLNAADILRSAIYS